MSGVKGTAVKPSQALNLDTNQQKLFIKFYKSLGEKPQTTVRFFDRSDYYSLHGEDAHLAAKSIFKSTTCVKTMSPSGNVDEEVDYICLSKGNFEIFLKELLLVKNYRVEVYTNKGRSNEWILEYKGSPGNLSQFEDLLFSNNEMIGGTAIIGVNIKKYDQQIHIGIAHVEFNERLFSILEFTDDDFFAELEALVVLLGPKECLLPTIDGDFERIKTLMERNGILITVRKKTEFAIPESELLQDLNRLLRFEEGQQENANVLPEISKKIAMSSLGSVIKYLNLIDDNCNLGHFEIKLLNLNRFVHLDAAAVSALNLLPPSGTSINTPAFKWQSILGVLDQCRTAQGHRLMAQWIKQPLRSEFIIKERHDMVQCFVDASTGREELYDNYMKRIPDIMILSKKLMRKKASLQDIYRLYQVVGRMPKIISVLNDMVNTTISNSLVSPMNDTIQDLKGFKQMVEQIMDIDSIEKGEYLINPSFDDELREMKETMNELEDKMTGLIKKVSNDLNLEKSSIKLEYVSHLGYHFRITLKDETALRKNNKYKIFDAVKGGVRFASERLIELNQEFVDAKRSYEDHQKSIVEEVVKIAVGYLSPLTCLNNQIAQLDCLLSFAIAAVTAPIPYIRPKMYSEDTGHLELCELRHPCLELQKDVQFIANDVKFKQNEINMYIITGPNMGGKSTYIRSVGAAVLMAHVGSFVPCSIAHISIVDSILGRIGANDNISKGLSTFMVEMIETSAIIRTATNKSLVVIDELGRGTSTYEGCGIAWSIAEHLATKIKCFTLFATHFHEITELAKTAVTVKNCHMAAIANNDDFILLYQVQPGVIDRSFGINVAKLANLPNDVVKMAEILYNESVDDNVELKSEEDNQIINYFINEITTNIESADIENNDKIEDLMKDIRNKVKNSNSKYFQATFPIIFQ